MPALKYSKQRECIKASLKSRTDHPTADMIYASVKEEFPNISLGTVYRNLALLVDQGEIIKLSCDEGWDRYDGCVAPHYHFLCRKCGCVSDLRMPAMEHINVLAGNGFDGKIDGHVAWFYGTCGECLKMKDEK